jgi:hypothetical protein
MCKTHGESNKGEFIYASASEDDDRNMCNLYFIHFNDAFTSSDVACNDTLISESERM